MIASKIGRTLLNTYNEKYKEHLSPQEFFEQVFFPLFYDHEKYMQWVTNSPFVQGIRKGVAPTPEERLEKLAKLKAKIVTEPADASIAIGFPSVDTMATTSGQLSNVGMKVNKEDVYLSWIGGGCGIGVQGGLSMYFDNPLILITIFEGWKVYRNNFLNVLDKLRPNQIDTWNGQWIAHVFGQEFDPKKPLAGFEPMETDKSGTMELVTQSWLKVIYGIANQFPKIKLTGYIFNLGQTNRTIGFIPFNLPQINLPIQLYKKLFGANEYLKGAKQVESILGSEFSFVKSCEMGAIGIRALEPKGLKGFVYPEKDSVKLPDYKKAKDIQLVTYNTYITWILAMLNANETLWEKAGNYAQALLDYEEGDKKGSTKKINRIEGVLQSTFPKQFIDGLTELIKDGGMDLVTIHQLAEEADKMPKDNFAYFLTLIRFKYAYLRTNNKITKNN